MKHPAGVSAFALKVVAIVGMACNHVANVFCPLFPNAVSVVLYATGGVTFPIMCFLLVEGYRHTSDVRKYALRLAVFAAISQIPYSLLWGATPNVLWTLLVALGLLWAYDNLKPRWAFWVVTALAYVGTAPFDWGSIGTVLALLFYLMRGRRFGIALVMLAPFAATAFGPVQTLAGMSASGLPIMGELFDIFDLSSETTPLFFSYSDPGNHILQAGFFVANFAILGYATLGFGAAAALLSAYNGRRGRPLKFFFYAFYPAHLLVIWLLSIFL